MIRPLVGHLARAVSWGPLAVVGLAGLLAVALTSDPGATLLRAQVAGVALGAAGAYVLDDPAAMTLGSSPTSLAKRCALRLTGGVLVALAAWGAIALAARGDVPLRGLTLEALTFLVLGFAVAALSARLVSPTVAGTIGSVIVVVVAASGLVARARWWPIPTSPLDPSATRELAVLTVVGLVLLLPASRDPAARTLR